MPTETSLLQASLLQYQGMPILIAKFSLAQQGQNTLVEQVLRT